MMIICIVARRIWTHGLGGLEEHARAAAAEMVRQGHTVHVLTTAHPDGRGHETAYGASVHYLCGTPPGDYSRVWWRKSRRWAREQFPRLGVEAVLSLSMAGYGLVGLGGPPIYTILTGWGFNQLRSYWHDAAGWRRFFEFPRSLVSVALAMPKARALLRASERVLPVSEEIERQVRRYRVCRIPSFVDTRALAAATARRAEVRAQLGLSGADCVALMVSTLTRQKGVHLGLEACAEVARDHPSLVAVVVGEGPMAEELATHARRAAPHLRVLFVGPRPHDEVARYFGAADIFLLPSLRQEGLPTTILEAMAVGVPVVAMRAGGTPSAVGDGETGVLVPLGNVAAFTTALRALTSDPRRREAMGRAARARALAEFDQPVVVRRLVAIMNGGRC
jgi:glycosyltransferase involved in cell wall biosynthesis